MAGFIKLEIHKVLEYKKGAIFKTKCIGFEWFPIENQPECYIVDKDDCMYVATTEYVFGNAPEKSK